jgi:hypothetical protein
VDKVVVVVERKAAVGIQIVGIAVMGNFEEKVGTAEANFAERTLDSMQIALWEIVGDTVVAVGYFVDLVRGCTLGISSTD